MAIQISNATMPPPAVSAPGKPQGTLNPGDVSSPQAPQGRSQTQAPEPVAKPQLEVTVSDISEFVQNIQRSIQFSVSETSGRTIIKVYDAETDELIREIPSEEMQRIAEVIAKQLDSGEQPSNGILVSTNV